MKIVEENNETFIYPFLLDNDIEREEKDYCISVDKGEYVLVDGRPFSNGEIYNLVKALDIAMLLVQE